MAYLNLLDQVGNIENKDSCLKVLEKKVGAGVKIDIDSINKNGDDKSNFRYFDIEFNDVTEKDVSDSVKRLLLVKTPYKYLEDGSDIFFQFHKDAFGYSGAFVGTEDEIRKKQEEHLQNKKILREYSQYVAKNDTSSDIKVALDNIKGEIEYDISKVRNNVNISKTYEPWIEFCSMVHSRLLIPDHWDIIPNGLSNYFYAVMSKLFRLIKTGDENKYRKYCSFNNTKKKILFNSSLLDKFGNDILVVGDYVRNRKTGEYCLDKPSVVESKVSLRELGFSVEDTNRSLEQVRFYKNADEIIFKDDFNSFDLSNWETLTHCLIERKDRYPEHMRNASPEVLCSDIIKAIEIGVKLSKYDYNYIKPMYNIKYDRIDFIIPYHINNNFQKRSELGIVIFKKYDYWQVATLLPFEEVYINNKTLSLYSDSWLVE